MSSAEALKDRLAQFKTKFTDFVSQTTGRRHTGYDELNQGLMAGQDDDDSRHTSSGTGGYSGPVPGYETHATGGFSGDRGGGQVPRAATFAQHVPSQAEEMVMLASLAKDAAELLWEMVATEDVGEATSEMRSNAATLQAQLRGLIGDYKDTDEGALATGLEAFDMLNNVLEEHQEAAPGVSGDAVPAASGGATGPGYSLGYSSPAAGSAMDAAPPPPAAAAAKPPAATGLLDDAPSAQAADEPAPLIEF